MRGAPSCQGSVLRVCTELFPRRKMPESVSEHVPVRHPDDVRRSLRLGFGFSGVGNWHVPPYVWSFYAVIHSADANFLLLPLSLKLRIGQCQR